MKITTIGGYSEVGKNMTAVEYNDDIVLLDMGVHLENYIHLTEDEDEEVLTIEELEKFEAIPDTNLLNGIKDRVQAIIPSHGHLDHVGAIPFLAQKFDAPIICTPYTAAVIAAILEDKDMRIPNKIIPVEMGGKHTISDSMTIEFVKMTHSIPDTASVVIHTPEGQIVYANDFKLDNSPMLGDKPDYDRLKELGDQGNVQALIIDSLYAHLPRKTPSEAVAQEMLKDVLLNVSADDKAVFVTTFSSHIARLQSIVECGKKMKRKVVFLGRSLSKYVKAAEAAGIVNFKDVEIVSYRRKIQKKLRQIEKEGRDKYLVVCTGHQGEPRAVLSRLANGELGFEFLPGDHVVFSCTVIPSAINIANREVLEGKLKNQKVRIFRDIHTSGHASREDHRDMLTMLRPKHVLPAHADLSRTVSMAELAKEMGYELGKTVHLMHNGQTLDV